MEKRLGSEKLIDWQRRLAKFDGSGLSVTSYCLQEDITPARFYYWSRRVREAGSAAESKRLDVGSRVGRQSFEIGNHVEVAIGEHV